MIPTLTEPTSGRCRKTPAAGGAQGFVTFPCLPALSALRAEPAPRPAPAGRDFLPPFRQHPEGAAVSAAAWRIADTPRGCAPRASWLEGNGPAQWATALDAIAGCSDRPALFSPQLFEAADNDGGKASPTDPGVVDRGRHFVTRHGNASNRRQYARAGLHLSAGVA